MGRREPLLRLFKLGDVAEALSTSERTLRRKIASGEIQALRFGGQWRITQDEFDRLTQEQRRGP
jgi:excisionase family DNA binding protein